MESFHSFLFLHSWRFFSLIFAIDFYSFEGWSRDSIFPIFLLSWWWCLTGRLIRKLWKSEYCLLLSPNWFIRKIIFAGVCIGTIHFIILKFWMSPMLNSFQCTHHVGDWRHWLLVYIYIHGKWYQHVIYCVETAILFPVKLQILRGWFPAYCFVTLSCLLSQVLL